MDRLSPERDAAGRERPLFDLSVRDFARQAGISIEEAMRMVNLLAGLRPDVLD